MRDALGRWLPGPDPDRHRLTREENAKGYAAAMESIGSYDERAYVWLRARVWTSYSKKPWRSCSDGHGEI